MNKKNNLKIGIDLDNVLNEFSNKIVKFYNKKYDSNWKLEDFKFYNLFKTWGGDIQREKEIFQEFYHSNDFDKMVPVENSQSVLNELKKENDLFVITSRPVDISKKTIDWIDKYFPKTFKDVVLTNEVSLNNLPFKTKSDICDNLDIDIFIDDCFNHISQCVNEKRKCFLYDAPWNKNDKILDNMERVYSWNDILKKILDVNGE